MKAVLALAAALTIASPAAAQPQGLSVADFLLRAQALMMGEVSADSPEVEVLRSEVMAAGKAVRAQQAADKEAGRPATFCMPVAAEARSDELIAHLQKLPAASRSGPFREAFADYAKAKYPCPAR